MPVLRFGPSVLHRAGAQCAFMEVCIEGFSRGNTGLGSKEEAETSAPAPPHRVTLDTLFNPRECLFPTL